MRLRLIGAFGCGCPSRLKHSDASFALRWLQKTVFRENILHGMLATIARPAGSKPSSGKDSRLQNGCFQRSEKKGRMDCRLHYDNAGLFEQT